MIQKIDQLIQKGHAWCALKELSQLTALQTCPNQYRAPLASLYRRVGKPTLGMRLLSPAFHNNDNSSPPTPEELIEYALCLHSVGATDEALKRFKKIDAFEYPETLVYQVHCHVSRWDYEKTIIILDQYMGSEKISPYQRAVAKTNLAAALVHCDRHAEANSVLAENLGDCANNNWVRLIVNNKEIQAQSLLQQNRIDEAQRTLESTSQHLVSDILIDRWFVQKWKFIIRSRVENSVQPLLEARELAQRNHHWESVRDLDFQIFQLNGDREVLNRVYFGTPFQAFRDRLSPGIKNLVSTKYEINPGSGEKLDSQTGRIGKVEVFNPGKNIHRVLLTLIEDLYRPMSIGQIFCKMFPGEVFNPEASTNRIHQLLLRTRKHFEIHKLPLEIVNEEQGYRLIFKGDFSIIKHDTDRTVDSVSIQLEKLQAQFFHEPFATKQAEGVLAASTSTTTRLLNRGIKQGLIEKTGKGPKTRYRFCGEPGQQQKVAS